MTSLLTTSGHTGIMACNSWKLYDTNYLEISVNYSSCCWSDSRSRETSPHCKISGKIDRAILLMSGYTENGEDENMFQPKCGEKQEVG